MSRNFFRTLFDCGRFFIYPHGPGVEKSDVAEEKEVAFGASYLVVIDGRAAGTESAFVPPVDDFNHFVAAAAERKCNRALVDFVPAVGFDLDNFVRHNGNPFLLYCRSVRLTPAQAVISFVA